VAFSRWIGVESIVDESIVSLEIKLSPDRCDNISYGKHIKTHNIIDS